jgi:hypothetical protein
MQVVSDRKTGAETMAERTPEQIAGRLAAIQRKIRNMGPVMRGSVTIMGTRHKQPYFSVSVRGRTRLIYLGNERAKTARRYVDNHRKLAALVDEMTLLYMEQFRTAGKPGQQS